MKRPPSFVGPASAAAVRAAAFACPKPWTARRWCAAKTAVATLPIRATAGAAHRARTRSAALDSHATVIAAASRCWPLRARPSPSALPAKGCSAARDHRLEQQLLRWHWLRVARDPRFSVGSRQLFSAQFARTNLSCRAVQAPTEAWPCSQEDVLGPDYPLRFAYAPKVASSSGARIRRQYCTTKCE